MFAKLMFKHLIGKHSPPLSKAPTNLIAELGHLKPFPVKLHGYRRSEISTGIFKLSPKSLCLVLGLLNNQLQAVPGQITLRG